MSDLRLSDLNKETTYLLTYSLKVALIFLGVPIVFTISSFEFQQVKLP